MSSTSLPQLFLLPCLLNSITEMLHFTELTSQDLRVFKSEKNQTVTSRCHQGPISAVFQPSHLACRMP